MLTPQESESLFATLAQLVADGLSVIFISHKLDEVLRVSDRIAVLRGANCRHAAAAGADKAMLAELMVGRPVAPAERRPRARGDVVVARSVHRRRPARPEPRAACRRGGRHRRRRRQRPTGARRLLCGLHRLDAGALAIEGAALPAEPRAFIRAGVARIPEDRPLVGVVGDRRCGRTRFRAPRCRRSRATA